MADMSLAQKKSVLEQGHIDTTYVLSLIRQCGARCCISEIGGEHAI